MDKEYDFAAAQDNANQIGSANQLADEAGEGEDEYFCK